MRFGNNSTGSGCLSWALLAILSLGWAFTSEAFVAVQSPTRSSISGLHPPPTEPVVSTLACSTALYSSSEDDEDDGWGTSTDGASSSSSSVESTDRKLSELRSLQEQASNKAQQQQQQVSGTTEEPERDMFIPIMAVVSLAGLFGAYGYETLRLASRGELYLPF
eukprot:CAMPEP_0172373964 /NCGR_PEP_ID=MMETSP1060-20121228/53907_1 /TAXON_ID=37318 /ORGANISM="Pseudo-nitzschia pungens, Strain cf. cingulata" /LENGTH=163 /DNA_ID=CAMNT_0013100465 /DNA_START=115 /DNA_END=606 /DNA_ORIENTATION=+